jgi:hypothetical protein
VVPKALRLPAAVNLLSEMDPFALNCDSSFYVFLRMLIVIIVFHEPSGPRIDEVNTL